MSDLVEWEPCTHHAREGITTMGLTLNGKANHECTYCLRKTVTASLAAIEVLVMLVDGLATAVKDLTIEFESLKQLVLDC